MTMLGRKERPLARKHRRERDDRLFVIATEDTYAPKQYFSAFELPRVSIHVIESVDGKQFARHVVARLKAVYEDGKRRGDLLPSDAFWALVDTDHYAQGHHVASFSQALKEAKDAGFKVAVSNPCFELWLLLHVADAPNDVDACSDLEEALRRELGAYSKANVPVARLMPGVDAAIARAERLNTGAAGWPQTTGTQVHLLVRLLREFEAP